MLNKVIKECHHCPYKICNDFLRRVKKEKLKLQKSTFSEEFFNIFFLKKKRHEILFSEYQNH